MIVVPSDYFKNIVLNKVPGISLKQLFVSASGGVDKNVFTCLNSHVMSTGTIVYVSRIDAGKGCFSWCYWGIEMSGDILGKKVLFVGYGGQTELLNKKIKEFNLSDCCCYLGPKTHQELNELYNQSDVMIFPTMLYESLGLVGIEAMACGIGSNIGCLPEYIRMG